MIEGIDNRWIAIVFIEESDPLICYIEGEDIEEVEGKLKEHIKSDYLLKHETIKNTSICNFELLHEID